MYHGSCCMAVDSSSTHNRLFRTTKSYPRFGAWGILIILVCSVVRRIVRQCACLPIDCLEPCALQSLLLALDSLRSWLVKPSTASYTSLYSWVEWFSRSGHTYGHPVYHPRSQKYHGIKRHRRTDGPRRKKNVVLCQQFVGKIVESGKKSAPKKIRDPEQSTPCSTLIRVFDLYTRTLTVATAM